jgi:serine/threonine-protein phosphatase 6 catalytic subunit
MSVEQWYESAVNCRPITESAVRQLCSMVKAVMAE